MATLISEMLGDNTNFSRTLFDRAIILRYGGYCNKTKIKLVYRNPNRLEVEKLRYSMTFM